MNIIENHDDNGVNNEKPDDNVINNDIYTLMDDGKLTIKYKIMFQYI
jgi:hypothetical protein